MKGRSSSDLSFEEYVERGQFNENFKMYSDYNQQEIIVDKDYTYLNEDINEQLVVELYSK